MSIVIKSKAKVFGDAINSHELLEALKNSVFKEENAPVQIFTRHETDFLKMIYICPDCNALHFVCGEMDKEEHIERLISSKILADHYADGKEYITKEELISVLEDLSEIKKIALEHTEDPMAYKLTAIYKCSEECPCIHLDCFYDNASTSLN